MKGYLHKTARQRVTIINLVGMTGFEPATTTPPV